MLFGRRCLLRGIGKGLRCCGGGSEDQSGVDGGVWFFVFFDRCGCAVESNRVFFVVNIMFLYCIAVSGVRYDRVWRRAGDAVSL